MVFQCCISRCPNKLPLKNHVGFLNEWYTNNLPTNFIVQEKLCSIPMFFQYYSNIGMLILLFPNKSPTWKFRIFPVFVKLPWCSRFPPGRWVSFAPKNVSVGFKTQKTQGSIQELLLNTKISGINGQKNTILFFWKSDARTLSILLLIKQLVLQHGVAMRYPSTWSWAAKGLLCSLSHAGSGTSSPWLDLSL